MKNYRTVQIPEKAKVFHFDLTTRCNLSCPMCPREIAKLTKKEDFDINLLGRIPIEETTSILLCGRTGDPSLYPQLFKFIEVCKRRAPKSRIDISTNGATKDAKWWSDLANLLKGYPHNVIFCLDGLDDTLEKYRKGSNFNKVIENAVSFINNGGHSTWKYVVFKHNEHQLEEAKEYSKTLGFESFIPIFSYHYGDDFLKPDKFSNIETKYERNANESTYIHCRMEKLGEFFISYNGYVLPCCHINPSREDGFFNNIEKMNLKDHTFQEIRNLDYFKRLSIKILFYPLCNNFCRTRIDRWANTKIDL